MTRRPAFAVAVLVAALLPGREAKASCSSTCLDLICDRARPENRVLEGVVTGVAASGRVTLEIAVVHQGTIDDGLMAGDTFEFDAPPGFTSEGDQLVVVVIGQTADAYRVDESGRASCHNDPSSVDVQTLVNAVRTHGCRDVLVEAGLPDPPCDDTSTCILLPFCCCEVGRARREWKGGWVVLVMAAAIAGAVRRGRINRGRGASSTWP